MMIYKNMHPRDFAELGRNTGVLHKVLKQKASFLSKEKNIIQSKILQLSQEVADIQSPKSW